MAPGPLRRAVSSVDGEETLVGHAGELHPRVVKALGLPARTCAMELDLDRLERAGAGAPAGAADLHLPGGHPGRRAGRGRRVPRGRRWRRRCATGAGELLESLRLFDVYTGEQLGEGKKSLAYALRFRAPDRTLTVEEAAAARDAAVALAAERTGAALRGA